MSKTEQAIAWMEQTAANTAHGYDQTYRWGEKGDYDCSSAVISAWESAGVPLKTYGATYTGNMYAVCIKHGFKDVTSSVNRSTGSGLLRGDILLNKAHHVAMYCGDGKEVEASINERGTAKGGTPGDQTGREFLVRTYRNYPWDCVLRYTEDAATFSTQATVTTLQVAHVFDRTNAGTWKVCVSALNLRSGAGTNYSIISTLPKGTAVQFYGYYNVVNKIEWWKVVANGNTGYICTKSDNGNMYVTR